MKRLELVGVTEIADVLGVSRQRASQLASTKGFPEPLAKLACGQIWEREAVELWEKDRKTCNCRGFEHHCCIRSQFCVLRKGHRGRCAENAD
jgi:hypothetical protein